MKENLCKEDMIDYKILTKGAAAVTDSELISVIIGEKVPGKSRNILSASSHSLAALGRYSYYDLKKAGLSHMKAVNLIASIELGRRRSHSDYPDKIQIRQSKDVADYFKQFLSDLPHEEFWCMFLNRSNRILEISKVSQGGISGTVTDVRVIMKKAIELLSSGLIICHNHPSGNLNPSEMDTKITQKIKESGDLLDIQLLDHIIISEKDYYSFADNGIL